MSDHAGPGRPVALGTTPGATAQDPVPDRIHAVPVRHPGRWVSAVVVLVLAAMFVHGLVTNDKYQWPTVWKYLFNEQVIRGVGWTLWLTAASMVIAIVLSVLLAIMRRSDNPVMRSVSWFYIWIFRGTPIYTQLTFWGLLSVLYPKLSLGVPFGPEWVHFDTADLVNAQRAAIIGLALNEAAYLAEIVRAGLQSVDTGQDEAARALGMKGSAILRRIILPQAMRVIVPPTGNETISMLKTTSLVLAVPFILDLNYATEAIGARIFQPIPLLVVAAIWYIAITSVLMVGQYYIERYYGRGFDAHSHTAKRGRQAAVNAAGTTPTKQTFDDMGRPEGGLPGGTA